MYQFYIIEIQKSHTGEYSHDVHWAFDADAVEAQRKAESKFHEVLSRAAVSNTAMHSATLISDTGRLMRNECYERAAQD